MSTPGYYPIFEWSQALPARSPSSSLYASTLSPSPSFHSHLCTTVFLPSPISPSGPSCSLALIYHIPPSLILDPYELSQLYADGSLGSSFTYFGEVELELPLSKLSAKAREGTGLVVEMDGHTLVEENVEMDIPLHGRYLESVEEGADGKRERVVVVEWPWVGWKCASHIGM